MGGLSIAFVIPDLLLAHGWGFLMNDGVVNLEFQLKKVYPNTTFRITVEEVLLDDADVATQRSLALAQTHDAIVFCGGQMRHICLPVATAYPNVSVMLLGSAVYPDLPNLLVSFPSDADELYTLGNLLARMGARKAGS